MIFADADNLGLKTAASDSNLNNLTGYCIVKAGRLIHGIRQRCCDLRRCGRLRPAAAPALGCCGRCAAVRRDRRGPHPDGRGALRRAPRRFSPRGNPDRPRRGAGAPARRRGLRLAGAGQGFALARSRVMPRDRGLKVRPRGLTYDRAVVHLVRGGLLKTVSLTLLDNRSCVGDNIEVWTYLASSSFA